MHPIDKQARVAGAIYLSLVLTAPFSLMYVPSKLIVRGDATATADKIRASEMLFRAGIVAELLGAITFIFVIMALYRLLRGVNRTQASLMAVLALISIPITFVNALNNVAALTLFRGADFLSAFDKPQRDAMAMFFLGLHGKGIAVNEMFWGLWLLPFGLLVIRSGFLPRILGVLLIVNCFAYVAVSLTSLLAPDYAGTVNRFALFAEFGELWIILWLLIKGARVRPLAIPA